MLSSFLRSLSQCVRTQASRVTQAQCIQLSFVSHSSTKLEGTKAKDEHKDPRVDAMVRHSFTVGPIGKLNQQKT